MTVMPKTFRHAERNTAVTGAVELKVFGELHETLNTVEYLPAKPWYIAEVLGVDIRSVQRALNSLEELGYLERGEKNGNGFTFRITMPNGRQNPSPPSASAA
jgi:DNA-binding transcriptional ArsR family regulator